jgi:3-oxoadipate enol-lactonase
MQVPRGDREIQYEISGRGDEAIVLIHALGATGEMWKAQIDAFGRRYLVITFEAGGHDPQGNGAESLTLTDRAADLAAVLDAVGVVSGHIVGLSMGGMIAQLFALDYPDRVRSLVLACTTARYAGEARSQLEARADLVESTGMAAILDATMGRWFTSDFRDRHPEVVGWIRDMVGSAEPRAYAAAARAVARTDALSRLKDVRAPTLILAGEDDPSTPPEAAETLRSLIPGAQLRILPAVAHLCNVQDPATFNRRLGGFLTQVGGAGTADTGLEAPAGPW